MGSKLFVGSSDIVDGSVTTLDLDDPGEQVSSSSGTFSTASTSFVDITNQSVTITTTGNPVLLMCMSDDINAVGAVPPIGLQAGAGLVQIVFVSILFQWLRDATVISRMRLGSSTNPGNAVSSITTPPGFVNYLDRPSSGTYTYKLQIRLDQGPVARADEIKIAAYELR